MAKARIYNVLVNGTVVFTGSYRTALVVYGSFVKFDKTLDVTIFFVL